MFPNFVTPSFLNAVNCLTLKDNQVINPVFELLRSRAIQIMSNMPAYLRSSSRVGSSRNYFFLNLELWKMRTLFLTHIRVYFSRYRYIHYLISGRYFAWYIPKTKEKNVPAYLFYLPARKLAFRQLAKHVMFKSVNYYIRSDCSPPWVEAPKTSTVERFEQNLNDLNRKFRSGPTGLAVGPGTTCTRNWRWGGLL